MYNQNIITRLTLRSLVVAYVQAAARHAQWHTGVRPPGWPCVCFHQVPQRPARSTCFCGVIATHYSRPKRHLAWSPFCRWRYHYKRDPTFSMCFLLPLTLFFPSIPFSFLVFKRIFYSVCLFNWDKQRRSRGVQMSRWDFDEYKKLIKLRRKLLLMCRLGKWYIHRTK